MSSLPLPPTTVGQRVASKCRRHSWVVAGYYLVLKEQPTHERLRCRWCASAKVMKLKPLSRPAGGQP